MKSEFAIGIDIGGTNIKGVLINRMGEVLDRTSRKTASTNGDWKENVGKIKDELAKNIKQELTIGLSAPGIANEKQTAIAFMPSRLKGLENFKWNDFLNEKNVKVLNDAHAALLAEASFGAGKGKSDFIMLTLGTGLGGGISINGTIYQGFHGLAGHFGHTSLNAENGKLGITNIPGSLEDAFGESTIIERSHGKFKSIKDLVDAFKDGDYFATYLWLKSVRELAIGICSFCNILSPEIVILGGGITTANEALFDPLSSFMNLYEWKPSGNKTIIKQAHFNEYAGAIGAASFAFNNN
jgi:glucokinase